MTLYPCPRCGRAPQVSVKQTKAGPLWLADCGCFAVHGSDKMAMAYSWALYCLRMEGESP